MDFDKLKQFFANDRFAADSGVVIDSIAEGSAAGHLDIERRHLNAGGVCQGGAIFTLADTVMAAAANSRGYLSLSVQSNVVFIASASRGRLTACAEEVAQANRLPSFCVTVTDEQGAIVAQVTAIFYRKSTALDI